jgi:hypothetical protein
LRRLPLFTRRCAAINSQRLLSRIFGKATPENQPARPNINFAATAASSTRAPGWRQAVIRKQVIKQLDIAMLFRMQLGIVGLSAKFYA